MPKPPTVFLGEMTSPEVERFLADHDTVIVPVGSTEQHGPHGPLLTDALVPTEVARRVAPDVGAVVAPTINYGLSYPHIGFTGLVHVRIPTFMAFVEDVVAGLAAIGFRRIVLLNGHYDNTYALAYACANVADRLPEGTRAFPINYWDGITADEAAEFFGATQRPARQPRRDLGRARDQPGARRHGRGERRDAAVPRGRQRARRAHRVLLLGTGLGPSRDPVGDVGRCARGDGRVRRALPGGRDARHPAVARRHRAHVRGDAAAFDGLIQPEPSGSSTSKSTTNP